MDTFTIVITTINASLMVTSVVCAIISVRQTRKQNGFMHQQVDAAYRQLKETSKQTEISQKQLEESMKPDFPTTMRLESIAHSIQHLDGTVKELNSSK